MHRFKKFSRNFPKEAAIKPEASRAGENEKINAEVYGQTLIYKNKDLTPRLSGFYNSRKCKFEIFKPVWI